jgi:hypothetical protein
MPPTLNTFNLSPGDKAAMTCPGKEWVGLYIHPPIRLHGAQTSNFFTSDPSQNSYHYTNTIYLNSLQFETILAREESLVPNSQQAHQNTKFEVILANNVQRYVRLFL